VPDSSSSPAPVFTSEPPPDRVPDSVRVWSDPMLNVAVPPNAIALEIVSDSVPDVAAVVVTVAPLRSESAGGNVLIMNELRNRCSLLAGCGKSRLHSRREGAKLRPWASCC
jgi:hypothetical protein